MSNLCDEIASPRGRAIPPSVAIVPAGSFRIGENRDDKFADDTERPRRRVTIPRAFGLGVFPVTVAEFRAFRPSATDDPAEWPVTRVTWLDAQAYCAWLPGRFRLPSEVEWEFAARAGRETAYPWGDEIFPSQANYLYSEEGLKVGPGHPTPRGTFPPNAFGLEDMCGNVGEWVQDYWRPTYEEAPAARESDRRVIRGGAWDYLPRLLRCSWRDALAGTAQRDNLGFRVACDL